MHGRRARRGAAAPGQHIPDGQSLQDVLAAADLLLRDLAAGWSDKRILIIAQSANKWPLDCLLVAVILEIFFARPFEWWDG